MGLFDQAKVQQAGLATTDLAAGGLTQLEGATEHNAWAQNKTSTGAGNPLELDSVLSNPARTHEDEKVAIYAQTKARMIAVLDFAATRTFMAIVEPVATNLKRFGGFAKLGDTVAWARDEISKAIVANNMDKVAGFVMDRITDAYFVGAKAVHFFSGTVLKLESPMIQTVASVHTEDAHVSAVHAETRSVVAREEVHKVAEAFGLEAEFLTALLTATATLKAKGALTLESEAKIDGLAPEIKFGNGSGEELILKDQIAKLHSANVTTVHGGDKTVVQAGSGRMVILDGNKIAITDGTRKILLDGSKLAMTDGTSTFSMDGTNVVVKNGSSSIKMSGSRIDLNPTSAPTAPDFSAVDAVAAYVETVVVPPAPQVTIPLPLVPNLKQTDMIPQYEGVNPIPFKIV